MILRIKKILYFFFFTLTNFEFFLNESKRNILKNIFWLIRRTHFMLFVAKNSVEKY